MNKKDLLIAYKVVSELMNQNKRASYNNSFMVVKNCLANLVCESDIEEEKI